MIEVRFRSSRHQARKVFGVSKKFEDVGYREGNPVGELKAVKHDWGQMATRQGCGHQFLVTTLRFNAARRSGTAYISTGKALPTRNARKIEAND